MTAHDSYRDTKHFGSLDGLRFLCISLVIWHHAPLWKDFDSSFFSRGHTGVDFFFVLSGFLITTLLLREDAKSGSINLKAFYWRRMLRIVPIYFLVVTAAAFYEMIIKGNWENLDILPAYYLFLSNFIEGRDITLLDPTWSLAVEEQYYLIWPALLLLLPFRWLVPVLLVLITWNVAAAVGVFDLIGITAIKAGVFTFGLNGPTYAPILMGSLVAILLHTKAGFGVLNTITGFRFAPLVWLGAIGVAYTYLPPSLAGWPNLVLHTLMCFCLISLVVREDNSFALFAKQRVIARIGQISYGIYLYHLFAMVLVAKSYFAFGIYNWWPILFTYFALSVVVAEISFRTFEAYFVKFRHNGWGKPVKQA